MTTDAPPTDLAAFLARMLDEDEAVALAASEGQHWSWSADGEDLMSEHHYENDAFGPIREYVMIVDTRISPDPDPATHIARHDPARVLADLKAKRAIVALHVPIHEPWSSDVCAVCVESHSDFGCENEPYPCATLRALAQPYADEPGWREALAPVTTPRETQPALKTAPAVSPPGPHLHFDTRPSRVLPAMLGDGEEE